MINLNLYLFVTLFAYLRAACAVKPVIVQGTQFVNSQTKQRLEIVGVDYQPGGASGYDTANKADPLSDGSICLRDAVLLQKLGVNTIRIYNINPALNHDDCVSIFNTAGIYIILDVNSPLDGENLNRIDPSSSYNVDYLTRVFSVIEAFKDYPNILGFFAGNEVINEQAVKQVPAYIRAVQRDMKDYISQHSKRTIPVGYSAADVRDILEDTWQYMECDLSNSTSSRSDFFGLNSYSWCGDSSYTTSGYDTLVSMFSSTTLPVFFSEYGCNEVLPRVFTEVQSIYDPNMTSVMAGGLVYEYSQEVSNFGLVILNDNNTVSLRVDYDNLMTQYNKLDSKSLQSLNSTGSNISPPICDSSLITSSSFLNSFVIPDIPDGGSDLIKNGISNPNNGELIDVINTKVTQTVYDSSGNTISGLELKIIPDDQSNTPGENTSGSSSGSGNGGKPKKSAATMNSKVGGPAFALVAAALAVMVVY